VGEALMAILDRHVVHRFLWNFVLLFGAIFLFGIAVDVVLNTPRFLEAADAVVSRGQAGSRWIALPLVLLDFHGPRLFQFFQFMVGLVSVGAMGFTFSQMHRARELTAIMAAGIRLRRPAMALLAAAGALNLLQLASQEWVLPGLAPRLIRTHSDLVAQRGTEFPVPLTRDADGRLLQAESFDPLSGEVKGLLVLERTGGHQARRRVSALSATWDAGRDAWLLRDGRAMDLPDRPVEAAGTAVVERPVDAVATNLGPEAIMTRRFRIYGQMLSTPSLLELCDLGGGERLNAGRLLAARVMGPVVNLLVLAVAIPFFLLREPRGLLQQSLRAAAFAVPASITAITLTTLPMPGLPPMLAAALPAAVLLPIAVFRLSALRS